MPDGGHSASAIMAMMETYRGGGIHSLLDVSEITPFRILDHTSCGPLARADFGLRLHRD